jgi:hypothetical protein
MTTKNKNNQLIDLSTFDASRVRFSPLSEYKNTETGILTKRVYLTYQHPDGSVGDVMLYTPTVRSFGVSENKSMDGQKVNGHTFTLSLWDREGATKEQKAYTDAFTEVVDACKDFLMSHPELPMCSDLERSDLRKLSPFYFKKAKPGEAPIVNPPPTLYAKLIGKEPNYASVFYDLADGQRLNPVKDLLNTRCSARAVIKIESLFFGSRISLQAKVYEANVLREQSGYKRLTFETPIEPKLVKEEDIHDESFDYEDEEVDFQPAPTASAVGEAGSLVNSEDEFEEIVHASSERARVLENVQVAAASGGSRAAAAPVAEAKPKRVYNRRK